MSARIVSPTPLAKETDRPQPPSEETLRSSARNRGRRPVPMRRPSANRPAEATGFPPSSARSLSDLGRFCCGKADIGQNLRKSSLNSPLFASNLHKFWSRSRFPSRRTPKSDRLLARPRPQPNPVTVPGTGSRLDCRDDVVGDVQPSKVTTYHNGPVVTILAPKGLRNIA